MGQLERLLFFLEGGSWCTAKTATNRDGLTNRFPTFFPVKKILPIFPALDLFFLYVLGNFIFVSSDVSQFYY